MLKTNLLWIVLIVIALLALAGCVDGPLDDGDAANVVLQVLGVTSPAVTGEAELGTCSISGADCLSNENCGEAGGVCTPPVSSGLCVVSDWTVQLQNAPLSEGAVTQPFNDVFLTSVTITYTNLDATMYAPDSTIPISATVPAGGTLGLVIAPIAFDDLAVDNTTINLTLTFSGATVSGDPVSATAAAQLFIEDCF